MPINKRLLKDFILFSQRQYDSLDYDPFHGLLVHMSKGLSDESSLWLSTLYMAYYNIGSAYAVHTQLPEPTDLPDWMAMLPVGVQRRNLYGGQVLRHLRDFLQQTQQHGSIRALLTTKFEGGKKKDWLQLQKNVGNVWGNGRWAVYTTSELYQKVNNIPVWPCDVMNEGSSGPRAGLQILYQQKFGKTHDDVKALDKLADKLFKTMEKKIDTNIPYLKPGHYDYAMMESQLCDFQSLCKGLYYVGRDIDRDQERIRKAAMVLSRLEKDIDLGPVWEARRAVFDERYLGEVQGWDGRTKKALQFYQKHGKVVDHRTARDDTRGLLY